MKRFGMLIAVASVWLSLGVGRAQVRLSTIFSDHMVLQRGVEVPVWGWAKPGEMVKVTLAQMTLDARTAADGRWEVRFPAMAAGGPYAMAVTSTNYILVKDIYVGEVWLGSGQSNMDFTVAAEDRYWCGVNDEASELASANYPLIRMFKVKLKMTDAPEQDVKGQWMVTTPETVKKYSATGYFFARGLYEKLHVPIGFIDASYGASTAEAWVSPQAMQTKADYKYLLDGYAKAKAAWGPAEAAKRAAWEAGQVTWAHKAAMELSQGKFEPRGPSLGDPGQNQHNPSVLYNGMIAPLIPYAIKGAVWYQGESNEGKEAVQIYRELMETLVSDWRGRWKEGDFPFIYVQLANLGQLDLEPTDKAPIARVRQAQLENLSIPNSAMAVTIDIGDAGNVHPKNKQELGRRLTLLASHVAYGDAEPYSGPLYDSMKVDGGKVTVRFKDAVGGLGTKGGAPVGFAIAGEDRKFYWATAKIDHDTVVLSSPSVASPVAVRYGWADNPPVNLYNKADHPLPASPFRTDTW